MLIFTGFDHKNMWIFVFHRQGLILINLSDQLKPSRSSQPLDDRNVGDQVSKSTLSFDYISKSSEKVVNFLVQPLQKLKYLVISSDVPQRHCMSIPVLRLYECAIQFGQRVLLWTLFAH